MKLIKLYTLAVIICLGIFQSSTAQTFTTEKDTVFYNAHFCPHVGSFRDSIRLITPGAINLSWRVVGSNFPSDWYADTVFGICDNSLARNNNAFALWNGTTGGTYSCTYSPSTSGYFALLLEIQHTTTPGTFWTEVQLTDGAAPYSKNIVFVITRFPDTLAPSAGMISGPSSVCLSSNIVLSENVTGGAWTATNGNATITGGMITPVSPGLDTIKYSVSNACTTAVATKIITIHPLPAPVVSLSGTLLSTTSTFVSYQWYLATTPISGATNATYNAISNGTYAVTVTDNNGCSGSSSAVNVTTVGLTSVSHSDLEVNVHPNPVIDRLTITANGDITSITIKNVFGTTMYSKCHRSKEISVNIADLPAGIYFVQINNSLVKKIVKR